MKCIIVDDEPLAREGIADLISGIKDLTLLGAFASVATATAFLNEHPVDLVFLDIEMPGQTGLQMARELPSDVMVIFTTAYPQYALESYEVDAVDYLVKPIGEEKFQRAVIRAAQYIDLLKGPPSDIKQTSEYEIIVKADRRYHRVPFDSILYINALKDYVVINMVDNNKIITWMNLKTIHAKLPLSRFLRVSKSFVVNRSAITAFDSSTVYIGNFDIPIGKIYQEDFLRHFLGDNTDI